MSEWEFYQIPHTGVDSTTYGVAVHTRDLDMRMSNFGALFVDARNSVDYTKTTLSFEAKGEMEGAAEFGLHNLVQDGEKNENPLVVGSTVKYTRNDEMFKMGMETDDSGSKLKSYGVAFPTFDVMDTNLVSAAGMSTSINYPTEGWRSFGGKYDFNDGKLMH
jgi:hypothetical protein